MPRLAVIYYSSTGHVHKLAQAVVAGAEETGAEVRLRRVPELAPEEVVRSQDAWHEHATATRDTVPEASLEEPPVGRRLRARHPRHASACPPRSSSSSSTPLGRCGPRASWRTSPSPRSPRR